MKANLLMGNLFDLESNEICDDISDIINSDDEPRESIKDLILQFWYQQLFTEYIWSVVTWLKPGHIPLIS